MTQQFLYAYAAACLLFGTGFIFGLWWSRRKLQQRLTREFKCGYAAGCVAAGQLLGARIRQHQASAGTGVTKWVN